MDGREGRLKWFNVDALPFDEMWEDDQYWCRLALEGTRLEGWFYFSGDFEKLIDHRIEVKPPPKSNQSLKLGCSRISQALRPKADPRTWQEKIEARRVRA